MNSTLSFAAGLLLPTLLAPFALAQEATGTDRERIAELERRLELLSEEIAGAQLGAARPPLGDGAFGFAPGAARIYDVEEGVSIGGYGEIRYDDVQGGADTSDVQRAIIYLGYRFDEKWLLNTEIEFEHATVENGSGADSSPGSVSVEFAYVEYQHSPTFGARAGLLLVPVGLVNELHEPSNFLSANRPFVEQRIIPSTWRENGFGVFGTVADVWDWRVYVVNGLDASGFSSNGLRDGRQKGGKAQSDDLAAVARVDYVGTPGLMVGGSVYYGHSGQRTPGLSANVNTTIAEGHVDYRAAGLHLRALFARTELDDVAELDAALGLVGNATVGESQSGWYAEAGYDVLHGSGSEQSLVPFVRYEELDTQGSVPSGFASNPARDREYVTFGVAWSPIPELVLKADYVNGDNGAGTEPDLFRLGLGWVF
ncbi:hypothetical protein Pla163_12740 [Planctomycetes bacterium Pla163]|uniref:Phosphate-selective porin O and P n=1 Tax=Rohdeia mirabilis TaxID=2528008 RepID=A0A518CY65_9BACT|nr:hypothetical protein Pla163_12740 [Planctomycetes bacterium Pla163]